MHSIPSIKHSLNEAFEEVITYIESQEDSLFEVTNADGKWSTGQQLEHLIKSVSPINLGLVLPKIVLKWKYGTTDRAEMNYEALKKLYLSKLNNGAKATKPYLPSPVTLSKKEALLKKYRSEKKKLLNVLDKWDEDQISKFVAPHPFLGDITIRELLFFTIYHNHHHLNSIKSIQ